MYQDFFCARIPRSISWKQYSGLENFRIFSVSSDQIPVPPGGETAGSRRIIPQPSGPEYCFRGFPALKTGRIDRFTQLRVLLIICSSRQQATISFWKSFITGRKCCFGTPAFFCSET
jgi:hypothetical protein